MYIDSYNYTNKGKYPVNEDSFFRGDSMFVVADGLGGHGGGNIASACAVEYISKNYRSAQGIPELISGANNAVRELNNGSRSTVAAAFVEGDKFHYTNIGDSRVYFFRNGKLLCRTKDHSVCQAAVDAGTMTEDEIRGHEDRSRLLRVLGETDNLKLTSYEPIPLRNGDAFLICSDGFWDFVYETEMETDLLKSDSAKRWGEFMLRRHLKRSQCNDDNFTLVCGIIHKEETESIPHTYTPAEIVIDRPSPAADEKKDRRVVIGVVVGILVCAALLVGGFFLFRYLSDKNSSDSETESISSTSTSESNDSESSDSSEVSDVSDSNSSNSSSTSDETSDNNSSDSSEASGEASESNSPDSSEASDETPDTSDNSEVSSETSDNNSSDSSDISETSEVSSEDSGPESIESDDSSETSEPAEDGREFPLPPLMI